MIHAIYFVALLPLVGFAVLALFGRRIGQPAAGWLATVLVFGAFVASLVTWVGLLGKPAGSREVTETLFTWISVGGLKLSAGFLVDPLSVTMILFVTGVGSLIHLYAIGYMAGDRQYPKFFCYFSLFVFSMLLLVLGDNLVLTFVGWEGVGLCSYWLISFWFRRNVAASAGKKAFIYNRIGDFGFLLGTFLLFQHTGTLDYRGLVAAATAGRLSGVTATAASLLLFLAAVGKSAQVPLYPWLVDAMEGPTPVSALIHAATMVTAGVYLMCRISPILALSSSALYVVGIVGALTAFLAAAAAVAQTDIKKVLAYSTVSQLGYMFLAVGSRAYVAAIFLMVAHAFYKALLFLGSGSVIHALDGEQDLKKMGGLRRYLPLTYATFFIGWLAIGGIPPLGGFWAKGDVLLNAFSAHAWLWAIGAVTAVLTAYYLGRETLLAFFGDERWKSLAPSPAPLGEDVPGDSVVRGASRQSHPHEPSWTMRLPLVVLAAGSVAVGVANLPIGTLDFLGRFLGSVFAAGHLRMLTLSNGAQDLLETADAILAVAGVALASALWLRRAERPELEPAVLRQGWGLDLFNDRVVARGAVAFAAVCAAADSLVIDGAVMGTARLVRNVGRSLRGLQNGYVRRYLLAVLVGVVLLLGWALSRASI